MNLGLDITALPATEHVRSGDQAPAFSKPVVTAEFWEETSLQTLLEDGPVVLVFHAMDGDFPATYTFQGIVEAGWADWDRAQVVGVSISTPYEHRDFQREWDGFEAFSFVSDPACELGAAYGATHELDGMSITEHRPAVFVIDTEQAVQYAWVAEEYPAFPPYDDIEAVVTGL